MAPKKKGRIPSTAASTPFGDAAEMIADKSPVETGVDTGNGEGMSGLWTDEQEASLFKAMIRWKPVGMHKHFRMIAISEHLKNHGYNGYSSSQNAHTRIPGIWKRLGELYNLDVLDIREDSLGDVDSEKAKEELCEFGLPDDDFWELLFARRLAPDRSSSPPSLPHQLSSLSMEGRRVARRHSTVDDTDEPRSSPASARRTPSGRSNTRGSRSTRGSRLAEVSVPGGRQGSKAALDQGTQGDERGGEDEDDAMEEEEGDSKIATSKDRSKGSKAAAVKNSARRSGRKR